MEKCVVCGKKAEIVLKYGPHKFCKEHFLYFFGKRVRKTIRENKLIQGREKVAVALSGGKDSTTTLYMLNKIFSKSNPIVAIMVDEGIPGYRDKAIAVAKKNCESWKVPYEIVPMEKELGHNMIGIMKKISKNKELGSTCAFCGVFRRHLLNKKAREIGARKIATGHNLDDGTQSIVMNLFDNDLARLSRLGPTAGVEQHKEFVPRVKPLWETPEKEVIAFTDFSGVKYYKGKKCPFSWMAKRNFFRKMLNEAEEKFPGAKFSILASFKKLKPKLKEFAGRGKINYCPSCGNPTSGRECKVCIQLKKLGK